MIAEYIRTEPLAIPHGKGLVFHDCHDGELLIESQDVRIEPARKVGFMMARRVDDKVIIGWSALDPRDKFDDDAAWDVANARIESGELIACDLLSGQWPFKVPSKLHGPMVEFLYRCGAYFKETETVYVAV